MTADRTSQAQDDRKFGNEEGNYQVLWFWNRHLNLHPRFNCDWSDLLHNLRRATKINDSLVYTELEAIPCVSAYNKMFDIKSHLNRADSKEIVDEFIHT